MAQGPVEMEKAVAFPLHLLLRMKQQLFLKTQRGVGDSRMSTFRQLPLDALLLIRFFSSAASRLSSSARGFR